MKKIVQETASINRTSPIETQEGINNVISSENKNISNPGNLLFDLHVTLLNSVIKFRSQVCKECNYSLPTYYRKMRLSYRNKVKKKALLTISNADKNQVLCEFGDVLLQLDRTYQKALENNKRK